MSSFRPLIIAILMLLGAVPGLANAALVVDFSAAPLFAEANLLPGDAVSRTVTVTNTGPETETVEFGFANIIPGPLASEMELVVDGGGAVHVDDTFATLFAADTFSLGSLAANESRTYTFTAALPSTAANPLQTETFGFDLVIGFVGEEMVSDRARALTGGSRTLQLFNEAATVEESLGGAFVTWNSNRPATTYLVCGAVADGPFTLSETGPLFGYQFALEETTDSVVSHGMALTDLDAGEYECRPAGRTRASGGFTVGDPVRFTVPGPPGEVAGARVSVDPDELKVMLMSVIESRPQGSVLGVSSKGAGNLSYDEFRAELEARVAAATTSRTEPSATPGEPRTENVSGQESVPVMNPNDAQDREPIAWFMLLALVGVVAGLLYFALRS